MPTIAQRRVANQRARNRMVAKREKHNDSRVKPVDTFEFLFAWHGWLIKGPLLAALCAVAWAMALRWGPATAAIVFFSSFAVMLLAGMVILLRLGEGQWSPMQSTIEMARTPKRGGKAEGKASEQKAGHTHTHDHEHTHDHPEGEEDAHAHFTADGHPHTHPWDNKEEYKRVHSAEFIARRSLLGRIFQSLHGYVYGACIYTYLKVMIGIAPFMGPTFRNYFAERYHGKVLTLEHARALIMGPPSGQDIPRVELSERVIPYKIARDLILKAPPHVVKLDCPCRLRKEDHCNPVDVCLVVGTQKTVDFLQDHHDDKTTPIGQEEALAILDAEHKRGHVHTAFFKDACKDSFFCLCNCCKCCCGGIELMVDCKAPCLAPSGYVAQVDEDACAACGTCYETCPFGAISLVGEGEDCHAEVSFKDCMGCGACVAKCRDNAIKLQRAESKGDPLDIRKIAAAW